MNTITRGLISYFSTMDTCYHWCSFHCLSTDSYEEKEKETKGMNGYD